MPTREQLHILWQARLELGLDRDLPPPPLGGFKAEGEEMIGHAVYDLEHDDLKIVVTPDQPTGP